MNLIEFPYLHNRNLSADFIHRFEMELISDIKINISERIRELIYEKIEFELEIFISLLVSNELN